MPGTIQAENFDFGGENQGYHDTTGGNAYGVYRPRASVDIKATTDSGGGFRVTDTVAGEWLRYTFKVNTAGTIPPIFASSLLI